MIDSGMKVECLEMELDFENKILQLKKPNEKRVLCMPVREGDGYSKVPPFYDEVATAHEINVTSFPAKDGYLRCDIYHKKTQRVEITEENTIRIHQQINLHLREMSSFGPIATLEDSVVSKRNTPDDGIFMHLPE